MKDKYAYRLNCVKALKINLCKNIRSAFVIQPLLSHNNLNIFCISDADVTLELLLKSKAFCSELFVLNLCICSGC